MRGVWKKSVVWVLVAIFLSAAPLGAIFSFNQNVKNDDTAYAANCTNAPLSGNFATDITNNEACIVSAIPSLNGTDLIITELTQVMYGSTVTDPIKNDVPKMAQMVMDGIKGGSFSGTVNKFDNDPNWILTYQGIHSDLLSMISNADTEWQSAGDNSFLGKFFNAYQDTTPDAMAGHVTGIINNSIYAQVLPYAAVMYAALQVITALHSNTAVQNGNIADGMSQATFDEEASDYDKGNAGDSGTTTYLHSFPTFSADMQAAANTTNIEGSDESGGVTSGTFPNCTDTIVFSCAETASSQYVYQATVTWYTDFTSLANVMFNNQAVKDTTTLAAMKTAMVTAASAMSSGGNADGTVGGAYGRCGTVDTGTLTGIPNIGQAMAAALCQFVVLVQGFAISLLSSSLDVLGRVAGIPGLQTSVGTDSGLAAQLIPKELTANFLSNALNGQQLCSGGGNGCAGNATTMACTSGSTDPSCTFHAVLVLAHSIILRAVNVLLILIFLVLALATMLQIQVNNYSVQKLLAPVLIGFLLAQFSFLAIRVMVEASTYAANTVIGLTPLSKGVNGGGAPTSGSGAFLALTTKLGSVNGDPNALLSDNTTPSHPSLPLIFQQGVLNLFIIAAAVIVFILAFMFALRAIIIAFLTPLSALAFFALPIPPLKSMWGTWWKNFSSWLVMPIIACFWLWLAFTWLVSVNYGAQASSVQSIIGYLFAMVCFMAAMRTSTKVAGETKMVMDQWKGMGSKMWAATGGKGIKSAKKEVTNAGKLMLGKTGMAQNYRDYQAFQKRRQDRVDTVWKTGEDPKDAEKRAHTLTHANEQKAEKEAEIERLIADGEVKNKSAIDTLKHDIEHLQHEIDHIDDGFIANGGIKNLRHALQSRKNKIMMERIGQNMKRSQKDALEHKALAEVQSMAGLRLADNDREYQERDALMRESVDRSDMAKERRDRVDKQNYEGMSAIKYEKDAAGNDILSKPIRDERTKNIAGRTAKEINLSRMRTGLREKKLSEKYTADKLESDRIKQEARGNLLLVDENPDKDEDYQRYQEVERWLDAARDEQKAKSTTALPEAFSKPFHTSKAHSYTDHTGAVKQSSAHTRILSGPLILTEEERNSEAKMKSLIEASGHLQGMVEMMGQNKPETIRYAANRIMQLTPPDRVDQALVNMTVYGDPAAIQAMVGADAAKLQAAKDAGLIDASVTDAAGINNQTTNFDDVNYRRLRSAFGKSTVSQRIDKITGDRADIVKGTNYTKQADGSFVEKSYI